MKQDLHNQEWQALIEAIMNHTVGVTLGIHLASGVVIRAADQTYIVTVRHFVKGVRTDDLQFMFRPPGTFRHVPRSADIHQMFGRRATPLPIQRIVLSSDEDDLALLAISNDEVKKHRVIPYVFEKGATSPSAGEQMMVVGFPDQLVKSAINRAGEQGAGALAFAYVTRISGKDFQHDKYRPESHFLLTFDQPQDDMEITAPRGMSGGGVWIPPGFPPTDRIWNPGEIKLAGIQVGWFETSKLLKAVRIERLATLLSEASYPPWPAGHGGEALTTDGGTREQSHRGR